MNRASDGSDYGRRDLSQTVVYSGLQKSRSHESFKQPKALWRLNRQASSVLQIAPTEETQKCGFASMLSNVAE